MKVPLACTNSSRFRVYGGEALNPDTRDYGRMKSCTTVYASYFRNYSLFGFHVMQDALHPPPYLSIHR